MKALLLFTIQKKMNTNMLLLGYSPQPGCSGRPAGRVSSGSTFVQIVTRLATSSEASQKIYWVCTVLLSILPFISFFFHINPCKSIMYFSAQMLDAKLLWGLLAKVKSEVFHV